MACARLPNLNAQLALGPCWEEACLRSEAALARRQTRSCRCRTMDRRSRSSAHLQQSIATRREGTRRHHDQRAREITVGQQLHRKVCFCESAGCGALQERARTHTVHLPISSMRASSASSAPSSSSLTSLSLFPRLLSNGLSPAPDSPSGVPASAAASAAASSCCSPLSSSRRRDAVHPRSGGVPHASQSAMTAHRAQRPGR